MPCRVEPTEYELEASRRAKTDKEIAKVVEPLQKRNDELTHENDQLREAILDLIEKRTDVEGFFDETLIKKISRNQVEHRKEDLRRLEVSFLENIQKYAKVSPPTVKSYDMLDMYTNLLMRVRQADPSAPLEPQLGFDPDEY